MKGKVESLEHRTLRDGREYVSLDIDGERYSLWDKDYFEKVKEGDLVEYEWRKSGRYRNITQIGPVEEYKKGMDADKPDRDEQITRMSCLKSASDIMANAHMDPEEKARVVLDIAKTFERYVFGPREDEGVDIGGE